MALSQFTGDTNPIFSCVLVGSGAPSLNWTPNSRTQSNVNELEIQKENFDAFINANETLEVELTNGIIRYYKTINGIKTIEYYDVFYDQTGEIAGYNPSEKNISDQLISPNLAVLSSENTTNRNIMYMIYDNNLTLVETTYTDIIVDGFNQLEVEYKNANTGALLDVEKLS